MVGALGLAAGALFGTLFLASKQKGEALGGIAGQARETASSLAQHGLASGTTVAQTVVDKADGGSGRLQGSRAV